MTEIKNGMRGCSGFLVVYLGNPPSEWYPRNCTTEDKKSCQLYRGLEDLQVILWTFGERYVDINIIADPGRKRRDIFVCGLE